MYSLEHKKYLKKIKTTSILVHTVQIVIIVAIIAVWQIAADNEWINTFIYSSPRAILGTIGDLYQDGTLFHHIGVQLCFAPAAPADREALQIMIGE